MSEKEFVIVDGVRYRKGAEPVSWKEKLEQMNAKTTVMPTKAIKTKKAKKVAKKEPKVEEVVEPTPVDDFEVGESN